MKRFLTYSSVLFVLGLIVAINGCKHPLEDEPYPETYKSASGDFDVNFFLVLLQEDGEINFEEDSVWFRAQFNESATWVITIDGLSSGAQKVLSGTGSTIDSAGTFWNGASDNSAFFSKGESFTVTLSFFGNDITKTSAPVAIVEPKQFKGLLVSDFESATEAKGFVVGTDWFKFFDGETPGDGKLESVAYGVYPNDIVWTNSDFEHTLPSPIQGKSYYHMEGQDYADQPNDFFIGGFGHDAQRFGITAPLNETYVNFFLTTNGNTTTKIKLEIPGIGGDLFAKELDVTWTGWRMVSIKLSEFVLAESGPLGAGELIPELVGKISFQLMSGGGEAGNLAEANLDYLIITEYKPFSQND